jgi:hypothetical protein
MDTGIGDAIRERAGRHVDLPISDPAKPRRWHRFPCPFCGKERAAINYGIGMFKCFHADCGVTLWPDRPQDGSHVVVRFRFQIAQAIRNARSKFGRWVSMHDLVQQARQLVIEYDRSGELDDWEADVSGDQNELDRYVLRALNTDLTQWALKVVRRKSRESLVSDVLMDRGERINQARPAEESTEDIVMWISWPMLELKLRYGMAVKEIAKVTGVSSRTVNRRMAEEMTDAKQTYT